MPTELQPTKASTSWISRHPLLFALGVVATMPCGFCLLSGVVSSFSRSMARDADTAPLDRDEGRSSAAGQRIQKEVDQAERAWTQKKRDSAIELLRTQAQDRGWGRFVSGVGPNPNAEGQVVVMVNSNWFVMSRGARLKAVTDMDELFRSAYPDGTLHFWNKQRNRSRL